MNKDKTVIFSLVLLVIIALVAEAGSRVVFRISGQDLYSMSLFAHDAG